MKYWISFVDFVFKIISFIVKCVIFVAKFIWKIIEPIHKHIKPTAIVIIDWTNGKKTYIISIFSIIGLLVGYHEGAVNLSGLLTTVPCLITAMTIRHGMARGTVPEIEKDKKD